MTEVGMTRAGGEHQGVVGEHGTILEKHLALGGIDAGDHRQQGGDLGAISQ